MSDKNPPNFRTGARCFDCERYGYHKCNMYPDADIDFYKYPAQDWVCDDHMSDNTKKDSNVKPAMVFGIPEELMADVCKLVGWDGWRIATKEDFDEHNTK